jgi:hypothetical protein
MTTSKGIRNPRFYPELQEAIVKIILKKGADYPISVGLIYRELKKGSIRHTQNVLDSLEKLRHIRRIGYSSKEGNSFSIYMLTPAGLDYYKSTEPEIKDPGQYLQTILK